MDNRQINYLLKNHKETKRLYFGTFPIDLIPKKIRPRPCIIVVNLAKSRKLVGHWTVIYLARKPHKNEYFDSMGVKPPNDLLKHLGRSYLFNKKQIQSVLSTVCGQYTLLFSLQKARGKSLTEFVHLFSDDTLLNDVLARETVAREFDYHSKIIDLDLFQKPQHGALLRSLP